MCMNTCYVPQADLVFIKEPLEYIASNRAEVKNLTKKKIRGH